MILERKKPFSGVRPESGFFDLVACLTWTLFKHKV